MTVREAGMLVVIIFLLFVIATLANELKRERRMKEIWHKLAFDCIDKYLQRYEEGE